MRHLARRTVLLAILLACESAAAQNSYQAGTYVVNPRASPTVACPVGILCLWMSSATNHLNIRAINGTDVDLQSSATVTSVSNVDGTLTISPTTGAVVASLALGNANTWTGQQTFNTTPVIFGAGASATGASNFDLSGGSGQFFFPTGTTNLPANAVLLGASSATNTIGIAVQPNVATGATSVAFDINNQSTLSTSGALLFRIRNNGTVGLTLSQSNVLTLVSTTIGGGVVDRSTASALGVGSGTANAVNIGHGTILTTITGAETVTNGVNAGTALTVNGAVNTSGANGLLSVVGAASTAQTLSTEINFINFNLAQIVTWATGALTTERVFYVQAPTLAFNAASTVTTAVTLDISGAPAQGTNATITNAFALRVEAGDVTLLGTNLFFKHLVGNTSASTVTVGNVTQLGTGPSAVVTAGTDASGTITVTTGSAPAVFVGGAAVTIATLNFNTAYKAAPSGIVLAPANAAAAALQSGTLGVFCWANQASTATGTATIQCVDSGAGTFAASTAYAYAYTVIQ